jgi:hypothetical protein
MNWLAHRNMVMVGGRIIDPAQVRSVGSIRLARLWCDAITPKQRGERGKL